MVIQNLLKKDNSYNIIKECLDLLLEENCYEFYSDYLSIKSNDDFEQKYINNLKDSCIYLACNYEATLLCKLSKKELEDKLINIFDKTENYVIEDIDDAIAYLSHINNKELYPFIKNELYRILEKTLSEYRCSTKYETYRTSKVPPPLIWGKPSKNL